EVLTRGAPCTNRGRVMMLVDATYWPLVVIGPLRDGTARPDVGPRALARLASPEPRAIALVVPGHGEEAASALEMLLGWLREFEGQVLATAARLGLWGPDPTGRAMRH